jgi:hypothetical protein
LCGQAIALLLVNATANNLFSLDVTADELPEPTMAVSGALGELPKLVPLVPAPTLIAGTGAVLSAVSITVDPKQVYRLLVTAELKDLESWVKTNLVSPLAAKEVNDFFSIDVSTALGELQNSKAWLTEASGLTTQVDAIPAPKTTLDLINGSRELVRLLDAQVGLQTRLRATGVPVAGKIVSDATALNVLEFKGGPGGVFGQVGDSGALVVSTSTGSAGAIVGLLFTTSGPAPDAPNGRGFVFPFVRIPGVRPA